jgi:hypothetical protein
MGKIASGKSENAYGAPSFQAALSAKGFSAPSEHRTLLSHPKSNIHNSKSLPPHSSALHPHCGTHWPDGTIIIDQLDPARFSQLHLRQLNHILETPL